MTYKKSEYQWATDSILEYSSQMNTIAETHVTTERIDITKDQRFYELPKDLIKVLQVRSKNHLNNKDEYRQIPRLVHEPKIVDAD